MLPPAKLTCINPGSEHVVIPLNGNLPLVIGRKKTLDQSIWEERIREYSSSESIAEAFFHPNYFPLEEPCISRLHALITITQIPIFKELRYIISDMKSLNGVYVNGEIVGSWSLEPDNTVSFGNLDKGISFRFSYEK